jgi:histidine phosphotransferase ChpT
MTGETITLHHLDLLLSKVFHDLISPVSAARNGLELVREFGGDEVGGDAIELVEQSVGQAADRLTFFRMAFGGAGSGGGLDARMAAQLTKDYLAGRKIGADISNWPDDPQPDGVFKVVLQAAALAADCLPRGGIIRVSAMPEGCSVTAEGVNAAVPAGVATALETTGGPLSSETILADTLRVTAERFKVGVKPSAEVGFELSW